MQSENLSEIRSVRIKRIDPRAILPRYAHSCYEDAGQDLCAIEDVILQLGVPTLVRTGISIELPPGYEAQIRGRSGLGIKHGIGLAQGVGTIDPSYRGEIKVPLVWHGYNPNNECEAWRRCYEIARGDRIAQLIIARYVAVEWEESDLSESERGTGGFGSSGK